MRIISHDQSHEFLELFKKLCQLQKPVIDEEEGVFPFEEVVDLSPIVEKAIGCLEHYLESTPDKGDVLKCIHIVSNLPDYYQPRFNALKQYLIKAQQDLYTQ